MDRLRFLSAQRYQSVVPLSELSFRVTIYRAFVIEENKREELCRFTLRWDQKVYSPAELLALYREVRRQQAADFGAAGARAISSTITVAPSAGGAEASAAPAAASGASGASGAAAGGLEALPTRAELLRQLRDPRARFFTRPSTEDYIDVSQEECAVDPPTGPSLLAPVILRQHRRDQLPSSNMYLAWCDGALAERGAAAAGYDGLEWDGEEHIFMTLTAERDARFFTAKPSLSDLHTLLVDAVYIHFFTVEAVRAAPDAGAALPGPVAAPPAVDDATGRLALAAARAFEQHSGERTAAARARLRAVAGIVVSGAAAPPAAPRHAAAAAPSDAPRAPPPAASPSPAAASGASPPARSRSASATFRLGAAAAPVRVLVFGVVERALGLAHDSLYLVCQLVRDEEGADYVRDETGRAATDFTTQMAFLTHLLHDTFIVSPEHVFNVPFEHVYEDRPPLAAPLRLVVSAFTEGPGAGSLQRAVGYGSVSLPSATPGRHALRVPLWAPHPTGSEFVRLSLIGGGPTLVDARQAAAPLPAHRRSGVAVREGVAADSAGEVHVTVNIIQQRIDRDY